MSSSYEKNISKVCDYIIANIDCDLNSGQISKIAGISQYHFHRIFLAGTGVSVFNYIKMIRLKRASYQLVFNKELKIIDIALNVKYESAEAFSRAFKKVFNVTPSEFRDQPDWKMWHDIYSFKQLTLKGEDMKIEIVNFEKIKIAVLEYQGNPKLLNNAIPRFIEWRKESGESPVSSSRTFGLVYNDPNTTPAKDFRFDVCGEIRADLKENKKGIVQKEIPEGRCAVVRHVGSHDTMEEKIYYLYREWLPKSGEKVRDFPLYFQYHNFFPETSESELVTDIILPIE
ncbi:MAG: AraC family transcriptional regulator [Halobacteriovoraceae bacterium]|nr:AraC family transcriptional regulator [Halobacteriovoraceae bacterium]